jgi:hypothetical protein
VMTPVCLDKKSRPIVIDLLLLLLFVFSCIAWSKKLHYTTTERDTTDPEKTAIAADGLLK